MRAFDSRTFVLALRFAQLLLAVIVLSLGIHTSKWWTEYWHGASPSSLNFLIFTAIWTFLALAYLMVVSWRFALHPQVGHPILLLAIETSTLVFWFAGFAAFAAFVTRHHCSGHVCSAAKAADVFAGFETVVFLASTALAIWHSWAAAGGETQQKMTPDRDVEEGSSRH